MIRDTQQNPYEYISILIRRTQRDCQNAVEASWILLIIRFSSIFSMLHLRCAIRHIVLTKLFQGDEGKMNSICEKFIYYMDLIQFLENESEIFSTSMSRLHKLILEKFLAELCLAMEVENGSSGEHQQMTEMFMLDKEGQTVEVTLSLAART